MLNEQKIKTMTKLAIYEKSIGKEDLKINTYYKHDYILSKNIKTRIALTFGALFILGAHAMVEVFGFLDAEKELDLIQMGITYGAIYVSLLIAYSIISTRIYGKRYKEAQARLAGYKKLLERINGLETSVEND